MMTLLLILIPTQTVTRTPPLILALTPIRTLTLNYVFINIQFQLRLLTKYFFKDRKITFFFVPKLSRYETTIAESNRNVFHRILYTLLAQFIRRTRMSIREWHNNWSHLLDKNPNLPTYRFLERMRTLSGVEQRHHMEFFSPFLAWIEKIIQARRVKNSFFEKIQSLDCLKFESKTHNFSIRSLQVCISHHFLRYNKVKNHEHGNLGLQWTFLNFFHLNW